MALPELIRRTAEKLLTRFCAQRVPSLERGQLGFSFKVREDSITLFEERLDPSDPVQFCLSPVAQFRFNHDLQQWTLHYPGSNNRWHFYLNVAPSLDLGKLLQHLEQDPLNQFWD